MKRLQRIQSTTSMDEVMELDREDTITGTDDSSRVLNRVKHSIDEALSDLRADQELGGVKVVGTNIYTDSGKLVAEITYKKGQLMFDVIYEDGKIRLVNRYDWTLFDKKIKEFATWIFNLNIESAKFWFNTAQEDIDRANLTEDILFT